MSSRVDNIYWFLYFAQRKVQDQVWALWHDKSSVFFTPNIAATSRQPQPELRTQTRDWGNCGDCVGLSQLEPWHFSGQRSILAPYLGITSVMWISPLVLQKVPSEGLATTAFTFKTLLRHFAKRALTPRSLNVKFDPQRNYHKGRAGWLA